MASELTLDQAQDKFRTDPQNWDNVWNYTEVLLEYARDEMINADTFIHGLREIAETMERGLRS